MPTRHPTIYALSGLLVLVSSSAWADEPLWRDAPTVQQHPSARLAPGSTRRVILDRDAFAKTMRRMGNSASSLELPLPGGGSSTFSLRPSGVIPPGLGARYPELKSMRGEDAQGRRVRVDMGPDGIGAAVSDPAGDWFVRPEAPAEPGAVSAERYHQVLRRSASGKRGHAESMDEGMAPARTNEPSRPRTDTGVYRTFRIAMTATPSYTNSHGGTRAQALQGIVTAVNRINRIYERDFGVHLVLAEDNDKLVFTQGDTDPFIDLDPANESYDRDMALRNVEVVARTLSEDAFDVGHLLDARRDSGVVGSLGTTCARWTGKAEDRELAKAAGMTGNASPFGDPFHVDFIAHELGHQFGASHTFNGCTREQWAAGTALEPGSGSTVMGYAGLCGAHNLQNQSDDYFHGVSIEEVAAWLAGPGGACVVPEPARVRTPWLDTEGWQRPMTVPARTAFQLAGTALFAEPDAKLSYTFEQMDLGDFQFDPTLTDRGTGPLFRSRKPNADGTQTFPAMAVLLGTEAADKGDTLPTTERRLRFRMTVRDEREGLRSPAVYADRTVRVVDTGRAFAITAPAPSATLRRGSPRVVRWHTAGTMKAPIACPSVRIDLSVDGGSTFLETPLARQVPNEGYAKVHIPDGILASSEARLRVACADGRFFALSPRIQVR